jgi:hypothetical protein
MTHETFRESLALHALGAGEASEREALESHLSACPSCSAELMELRDTASSLALLVSPVVPSPGATERLLAMVDAGRPAVPADAELTRTRQSGRTRRWRPLVLAGRVAVAAVIVVLAVSQMKLYRRLGQAHREIRQMREIGAFVTSPEVSVVSLWGGSTTGAAHAKLVYHRGTGRFVLLSSDLAPPPEGERYQLWIFSEGIHPAAAFSPDAPAGVLRGRPGADTPFVFALSLEPSAETDEPTGQLMLMSRLVYEPR